MYVITHRYLELIDINKGAPAENGDQFKTSMKH